MKERLFNEKSNIPLYVQLYDYFKNLISTGQLNKGSKIMSIRRCCEEFNLSKTTVENAYLQLAAEGYIISRPQSGYYVCELDFSEKIEERQFIDNNENKINENIKYDFASSSVDSESFDFSLWQRYIKSALRQNDRLTSYGDFQGEADLRNSINQYISRYRSVVCSSENIIIGAGTQNLLGILCALLPEKLNIAFIGSSFEQGRAVFEDYGHTCFDYPDFPENPEVMSKSNIKLIYISPSHFTKEGDILAINRRLSLLRYAKKHNCLIIEDDYDSEFRYYSKSIPSLQGIDSGNSVIYIKTFSKLLIPSIRISFMVLPLTLYEKYRQRGRYYNQTASKLEQIALCQFIRDGHLNYQIRKQRKLFSQRSKVLCDEAKKVFGGIVKATVLPAGYLVRLEFSNSKTVEEIIKEAKIKGILLSTSSDKSESLILSCTKLRSEYYHEVFETLKTII